MQASKGLSRRFFNGVGNSVGRGGGGVSSDSLTQRAPVGGGDRRPTWERAGAVVGQRAVGVAVDGGAEGALAGHEEVGSSHGAGRALLLQRLLQPPLRETSLVSIRAPTFETSDSEVKAFPVRLREPVSSYLLAGPGGRRRLCQFS